MPRTRRSATTCSTPASASAAHVPVDAGGGHVGQLGRELAGGERPVAEERLDDAQPHRVQEQVSAGHHLSLAQLIH